MKMRGKNHLIFVQCVLLVILLSAVSYGQEGIPSLKEIYQEQFRIGFAARPNHWLDEDINIHQFNALTPENIMKWDHIHPSPGSYSFQSPDALVRFADEHDMLVNGHTLVWHSQTPDWVFTDDDGNYLTREMLLARMEEHIATVVGRYKGQIYSWDVVNEAIEQNSSGQWELRKSKWLEIIGEDYIEWAFRFAHDADPDAILLYNDYSATNPGKRDAIYDLVKGLLDKGVPIHGIGMQGHWEINSPTEQNIRNAIEKYASLGVKVNITEMDVSLYAWNDRADRYRDDVPESVLTKQAEQYAHYFRIFLDYEDVIERVTFWGVRDNNSWLNNYPVQGRRDHPLLFDRDGQPKPAFWAVADPSRPWYEVKELGGPDPSAIKLENVSFNRDYSASHDEDRAGRALDGSSYTSWSVNSPGPYWLAVDLGGEYAISRWIVKHQGVGPLALHGELGERFNTASYRLQKSHDGETWEDVDHVLDNLQSYTDRTVESFITRYVRLMIDEPNSVAGNNTLSIFGFEVFGTEGGAH